MNHDKDIEKNLVIEGVYKHYKGNSYKVLAVARHSEDLSSYVVYQALYGDYSIWIRPLGMFLENVTILGISRPRFEYSQE